VVGAVNDMVVPLSASSRMNVQWRRPAALLFCTDLRNRQSPPLQWLTQMYGFTPAEAKLALAVLAGQSPEEYALQARVSVATVRSQYRALYDKTGTKRQADLARVLGRIPVVRE